jgi:hypothetical protein
LKASCRNAATAPISSPVEALADGQWPKTFGDDGVLSMSVCHHGAFALPLILHSGCGIEPLICAAQVGMQHPYPLKIGKGRRQFPRGAYPSLSGDGDALFCYALGLRLEEQAMMLQLGVRGDYSFEALILVSMAINRRSLVAWIVALFWPLFASTRLA